MVEMTEAAVIVVDTFHSGKMTECELCYSLQPCIATRTAWRCVDWQACHKRQQENKQPVPVALTSADQAALLERMEIMQADMQRLKRIEAAALVFVQASEAFSAVRGHGPIIHLHQDLLEAERELIEVVKGIK